VIEILKSADPMLRIQVNNELLHRSRANIVELLEENDNSLLKRLWKDANRKKRALFAALAASFLFSVGGGSALVARNLLDEGWRESINSLRCDVSGDNAHLLVMGTDTIGTKTEYWAVKSRKSVVDVLVQKSIVDGASGGTMSCDHKARPDGTTFISFSSYALDDKVPHVALYGWIPPGTKGNIEFTNGRSIEVFPDVQGNVLRLVDFSALEEVLLKKLTVTSSGGQTLQILNLQMTKS